MLTTRIVTVSGARPFFCALIYILSFFHCPVQAETDFPAQKTENPLLAGNASVDKNKDIEEITNSILHKEFELERLNTRFRIETTLVSPWRQRRVFAYGESGASLTEAGLITALPVRYNLARKKVAKPSVDNKNKHRLQDATRTQMVGQFIGAGGDIIELTLNFINYWSIRKKGFNPGAYRKRVQIIEAELDNLIDQRSKLLNNSIGLSVKEIKIAQAEGKLLSDMRDLSLLEYGQYLSGTKRFWMFQNTAFLVDFAKNSTGAAGSLVNLIASNLGRTRMAGGGYLLSAISGAIVVVIPVVGRVTGNMSGLAAAKTASKELTNIQATNAETYLSDKEQFLSITKQTSADTPYLSGIRRRETLYDQQAELLVSSRQFLQKRRDEARRTLKENILFASIVGPPRIANGTLGMIANWHYYNNSPDRNKLMAAGTTAYLVGNTFNMFETARVQAGIELNNIKLAKTNLLPKQQFGHRLQMLDEMDRILTK